MSQFASPFASPACRAALLGIVLGLGCAHPLWAQALQSQAPQSHGPQFVGHWQSDGAGTAAEAPSAILSLDEATLSWRPQRRAAPVCKGSFTLTQERPGTVYRNARGEKFVAGSPGSFPTFLLKVNPGSCGGSADAWRLSFPLAYDRRHMELTEYQAGRPIGYRRMLRVD